MLLAFVRSLGLADQDAAEVAQVTLAQFAADYRAGRYDRSRGRLSSWILGIAHHRVMDLRRLRQRERLQRGESALVEVADEHNATQAWESARKRVIVERALERLRTDTRMDDRTITAFELCAIRNAPPETAAQQCGMSVAEVYVAKNRAIKKLREIVSELTREFDEP